MALLPTETPRNRLWWLQSAYYHFADIPESTPVERSICLGLQQPRAAGPGAGCAGAQDRGYAGRTPGDPGFAHLPWWSNGIGDLVGNNPSNFYYLGGTSMATPHVASLAALIMQKNPALTQAQVEAILKATALPIPAGSATVFDISPTQAYYTYSWGDDATGSGLVQADAALAAVP